MINCDQLSNKMLRQKITISVVKIVQVMVNFPHTRYIIWLISYMISMGFFVIKLELFVSPHYNPLLKHTRQNMGHSSKSSSPS